MPECAEGDITVYCVVSVYCVPGEENPADMLTKPLAGPRLKTLRQQAGMAEVQGNY